MKKVVFILDNGHGIDTKGKCSPDKSLYEWQWNREITSMLCERCLAEELEYQLLVPEDEDISLKERVQRANEINKEAKAAGKECMLISIHINAAGSDEKWHNATGWTEWVSNNASEKSKQFGKMLYEECEVLELQGNRSVSADKLWYADYYILKNTNCPAVLTENMFQDNKEDVELLLSNEGKQKIVDLHINAMKKYIEEV